MENCPPAILSAPSSRRFSCLPSRVAIKPLKCLLVLMQAKAAYGSSERGQRGGGAGGCCAPSFGSPGLWDGALGGGEGGMVLSCVCPATNELL